MRAFALRHPCLTLVLAALVVQGAASAVIISKFGRLDAFAFRSIDSEEFYALAQNLVEHGVFSQDRDGAANDLTPDTWRTPGFPAFLAAAMMLVGQSPIALIIVQQLLAVFTIPLVFLAVGKHMSAGRAMFVATVFLCDLYRVYDTFWLLSTPLFTTSLVLLWIAWNKLAETRQLHWVPVVGVAIGLAILIRPLALPLPFCLVFCLYWLIRVQQRMRPWLIVAVFVVSSLLFPALWMARNYHSAGRFALTHQSGIVLAYFKATEVELWRTGRSRDRYIETSLDPDKADKPHVVWDSIDDALQRRFSNLSESTRKTLVWSNLAQGNKTPVDSFAVSDALTDIGLSFMTASPICTVAVAAIGVGEILTFPLTLAIKPPNEVAPHPLRHGTMGAIYLILTLAVLWRLIRGKICWTSAMFPLAAVLALLLTSTPQIDPRFRIPMLPMLLFVAFLPRFNRPMDKT